MMPPRTPSYTLAEQAAGKIRLGLTRLASRYPFHARVLEQLEIQARPGVGTMAVTVSGQVIVLLNTEFVLTRPADELVGVLLHEVHHIILGHLTADPKDFADLWARTVAEEVTVNEYVQEPLPAGVIMLDQFPGLPPHESTAQRYERLRKVAPSQRFSLQIDAALWVAGPGAGRQTLDDHRVWGEVRDRQAAREALAEVVQLAAWEEEVPQELRAALQALGVGMTPGGEQYRLQGGSCGRLDWRALLRRYLGQALEPQQPTLNRPPRRCPHLVGLLPGRSRRPLRPRVLAVLDTSGSITADLLERIDGELRRLARTHQVTVVECDVRIHKVYPYRPLASVTGRGGTDLRPPLERAFLRQHRPDLVVYFTDGFGPAPDRPPPVPVIWCLTPGGESPAAYGRVVPM
jgi:predicted metal-dependent peptidase